MSPNSDITPWSVDYSKNSTVELDNLEKRCPSLYRKLVEFLTQNPDKSVGGHRAFPLKGHHYHNAWEYKVCVRKCTFRIFYILDTACHSVYVYYAGPKPTNTPRPPPIAPRALDAEASFPLDHHRSTGRKGQARR